MKSKVTIPDSIREKSRKIRLLIFRRMAVALIILFQAAFFIYLIYSESLFSNILNTVISVASIFVALYIINKPMKPAYRLIWVLSVVMFPVVGCFFYLMVHLNPSARMAVKRYAELNREAGQAYRRGNGCPPEIQGWCGRWAKCAGYLSEYANFPLYGRTSTRYLPSGEAFWESLLADLEKAKTYIYMEYFIVDEGKMTDAILEILARKASQGVEVRFLYDDIGCFVTLPQNYPQKLRKMGIKTAVFNPFVPVFSTVQNNRDHRKITVIDGKVAYTGGANLADEYINVFPKHGHWKDSAIRLEGDAVWSMNVMFLEMWALANKEPFVVPHSPPVFFPERETEGLVLPYADSPLDTETVGEYVYLQMIQNAERYLYIMTPYLIVDDSILTALSFAAKSGVDVRIITPHVWDKQMVHITTRSYYRDLIKAGVRLYEYTPGFVHAKVFVADDVAATVGTVNLDYRSLYLHFENGVFLYNTPSVAEAKTDFLKTLADSEEVTLRNLRTDVFHKQLENLLKLLSPLF
ncbi:MAG: cardiolipin synthase [Clostridia bacterium]|nr:cardiolipin synthase [Clostridia bacterium]